MQKIAPQQIVKSLNCYEFSDIESTIVGLILDNAQIGRVKNSLIKTLVDRGIDKNVKFWFDSHSVIPDLDLLEKLYELDVNKEERKVNGSYYTPTEVVRYIIEQTVEDPGKICDPACGSGAFLLEAAKHLKGKSNLSYNKIYSKFIYGVDILPRSVQRTKIMLSLLAIIEGEDRDFDFNLFEGDSLRFDWSRQIRSFKGFDYIVGNPPYVRTKNLRKDVREAIKKWETASFGNVDLYIPFFELATKLTTEDGKVGFITPSTYLTSYNAKKLREYLSENRYVGKIVDFNGWQIFPGATTYTCITILNKKGSDHVSFSLVEKLEYVDNLHSLNFDNIPASKLTSDEWRLLPKEVARKIFQIENVGSPLFEYVDKFITGIATLNNDLFLVQDNGEKYLKKIYKGKEYLIERHITKDIIKPNKIKDKKALENNNERIIYPYRVTDTKVEIIDEEILKQEFPKAYQYLLAIKDELALRDKGKKKYATWYAYGRTQGLNSFGKKIILPMMGNKPSFVKVDDEDTLIYCGYAIFPKKQEDFSLLEKILNSDLMWFYIKKTSKNYSGGFKSFAKNYVKNFSIPSFSDKEKEFLLQTTDKEEIERFLEQKYQVV